MADSIKPGSASAETLSVDPAHIEPIRFGAVSYLNTLPLIEGLGKSSDATMTLTAPSGLVDLLVSRAVDLALVSLVDYQNATEELELVPAGIIGCNGPTLTVRVFSKHPLDTVTEFAADADSHTSVVLAQILLHERTGRVPRVHELTIADHEPDDRPDTILMIGDKVMTDSPPAVLYPHQLDLGEAWKAMTGLPFVYAIWMCRSAEGGLDADRLRNGAALLDRQRRHNATRIDWIASVRGGVRGWPDDQARRYLTELLCYELTDEHRRAIDVFFDRAHELGLIRHRRPTRWARI